MCYGANQRPAVYSLVHSHFSKRAWPPPITIYVPDKSARVIREEVEEVRTLPVLVFLTSKATSLTPSGPVPTFHAFVSSPSPGATGAVYLTLR